MTERENNKRISMSKNQIPVSGTKKDESSTRQQSDDYINDWDDYFFEISKVVARKSKDPKCSVGAVITSTDSLIISTGFNGLARDVYDTETLLNDVDEKLLWICHAEFNAIVNATRNGTALKGGSIYVTKFPCFACLNAIVQAGIERIYTLDDKYWDEDPADGVNKPKPHSRKKELIRQSEITIDAPFHPDFELEVFQPTKSPLDIN